MSEEEKKAIEKLELMEYKYTLTNNDDKAIEIILNLIEKQRKKIEILEQNYGVAIEQNKTYKANIYDLKKRNKNLDKGLNNSSGHVTELIRENTKLRYEQFKNKEKIKELEEENLKIKHIMRNPCDISIERVNNTIERLDKALTEVEQMPTCATRYDTIQRLSNQIEILERLKEGGE